MLQMDWLSDASKEMRAATKGWTDRERMAAYQGYTFALNWVLREESLGQKLQDRDGNLHDMPLPPKFLMSLD